MVRNLTEQTQNSQIELYEISYVIQSSLPPIPQLFVGGLMPYCAICIHLHIVMFNILAYLMCLCSESSNYSVISPTVAHPLFT
jgi:hypothetical protein